MLVFDRFFGHYQDFSYQGIVYWLFFYTNLRVRQAQPLRSVYDFKRLKMVIENTSMRDIPTTGYIYQGNRLISSINSVVEWWGRYGIKRTIPPYACTTFASGKRLASGISSCSPA